jgi:hypothetical protein
MRYEALAQVIRAEFAEERFYCGGSFVQGFSNGYDQKFDSNQRP